MATRLRLQRHGKKGKPFYHMVAADARSKRDGRFIEKIGTYNPNTNPATIEINHDRALYWLGVGAQPSDTARAILKYTGAIYHNHLLKGVAKGALTEAEANKRFEAWYNEKQGKIEATQTAVASAAEKEAADTLAIEKKIKLLRLIINQWVKQLTNHLYSKDNSRAKKNAPIRRVFSITYGILVWILTVNTFNIEIHCQ